MPVYEYQCKECRTIFEREHSIGEKKKYRCPNCSSKSTRKIVSQVGVIFKGNGFYVTDNRNGNVGGKSTVKSSAAKPSDNGKKSESTPDSECSTCKLSEN